MLSYTKTLTVILLLAGLTNPFYVSANSEPVTSDEVAAQLSNFAQGDKKELSKLVRENKRLLKNIKGVNKKTRLEIIKSVNELEDSLNAGLPKDTIENTIDGLIRKQRSN